MTATAPNSEKNNRDSTQISINQGGQIRSLGYSWSMESKVVIRKPKKKNKRPKQTSADRSYSKRPLGHTFWLIKKKSRLHFQSKYKVMDFMCVCTLGLHELYHST